MIYKRAMTCGDMQPGYVKHVNTLVMYKIKDAF